MEYDFKIEEATLLVIILC